MARYALSFDIGGTFTDFVLFEIGSNHVRAFHKVLTTAREPALGVLQGWRELIAAHHLAASDVVLAVHSTTLVTNTIIERRGAVAGLLATEGLSGRAGDRRRADLRHLRSLRPLSGAR